MKGESRRCPFAAERGGLHLSVGESQVVVKRVEVHEKAVEVVAQSAEHTTVARLFACLEEEVPETLQHFFI